MGGFWGAGMAVPPNRVFAASGSYLRLAVAANDWRQSVATGQVDKLELKFIFLQTMDNSYSESIDTDAHTWTIGVLEKSCFITKLTKSKTKCFNENRKKKKNGHFLSKFTLKPSS